MPTIIPLSKRYVGRIVLVRLLTLGVGEAAHVAGHSLGAERGVVGEGGGVLQSVLPHPDEHVADPQAGQRVVLVRDLVTDEI